MTLETLLLFEHLLNQVQLPASAPDFKEAAERIINARADLNDALEDARPAVD